MQIGHDQEIIHYCSFNQEQTYFLNSSIKRCVAIGTNYGFKIFAIDPFALLYSFGIFFYATNIH